MKMSPAQNKRLNALLTQTGMNGEEEKSALVLYFTANRSTSRKDLEPHQAQALIDHLASVSGLPGYTPPRHAAPAAQPAPVVSAPAAKPSSSRASKPKAVPSPEAANRMRRKIFAIGRAIGWLSGDTDEDRAMNRAKLDTFLRTKSYLKKPLNYYAPAELPKLVAQFELIEKHYAKSADNRAAGDAVAELLAGLDLSVAAQPARRARSTRKPAL
ncbi:hypothetical protein [Hymenobacter sp. IS2118]|uniref:hypothetical protein n=1 Tax=Hymenobacter sp. IS2118 TaxID=1505605 RepID=UPI00054F1C86|nr:hypothetical protein [Hymenobacter sp. IS2118]